MSAVIIKGCGFFCPRFPSLEHWQKQAASESAALPSGDFIDKRNKRRASTCTRAIADAYGEALAQSGFAADEVASVFGSALGEAKVMVEILHQIFAQQKAVSPMRFAVSVHNAASGIITTTSKNHGFTTSVGADFDTPAMALLEGLSLVRTMNKPVVVVCGDEAVPLDLDPSDGWDLMAAAVVLAPAQPGEGGLELRYVGSGVEPVEPWAELAPELARNPQAGMLDLVDAVLRRRQGVLRLDRGRGRGYAVEIRELEGESTLFDVTSDPSGSSPTGELTP